MTEPIRGKVARILNSREMVINVGSDSGVACRYALRGDGRKGRGHPGS